MYEFLRDCTRWVLPEVLNWQANRRGAKTFVQIVDGQSLTYAEARGDALRVAAYFNQLGVRPGDTVAVMLPNDLDFIRVWLGLSVLGAVAVLLNTELKGSFLEHQLRDSGARVAVASAAFFPAIRQVSAGLNHLEIVAVSGADDLAANDSNSPWRNVALSKWRESDPFVGPVPNAHDNACIMYTSGTTGPSKGVLMPHAHCYLFGLGAIDNLEMTPDDRYYVTLPLFHANGLFMQIYSCLIAGATALLKQRFSADAWLDDVRRHEVTLTNTLGVVAPFIFARPARSEDKDHKLRVLLAAPNPPEMEAVWRDRFGIRDVVSGYGMTEVNIAVWGRCGGAPGGCAGRPYERYFEIGIFEPTTNVPLPAGVVGEIMVRPRAPFGFMAGYHNLPEKTCEAWRNLWFHTGDAGYIDGGGFVFFVDRIRDCIRRRGHNISSFEIERGILSLEGVAEVAAYPIPSDIVGGEDEVVVSVVPRPEAHLTAEIIAAHVDRELPRFAQPRFIAIVASHPKTETGKIQKALLRERGVHPGVWDREANRSSALRPMTAG